MAAHASPDPNEKLVRVFDTEQESEGMVVRGLLQAEGIDCDIAPIDLAQDVFPMGGVMILVREEDAERAREIIEEYRRTPEEQSEEQAASGSDAEPQPDETSGTS